MTFKTVINQIILIFNLLIQALMVLGTLVFLYGVITYLFAAGDEQKLASGKYYMLWGIISLFVMLTVWGLVFAIEVTFGVPRTPIPILIGPP